LVATWLSSFVISFFVAVVLVPPLREYSGRLQLLDIPDTRKIHAVAVPRCGGIGIAAGALIPVLLWGTLDPAMQAYLVGAAIIIAFGLWDDFRPLNFKWKLVGQVAAAMTVMQGGVLIEHVPLLGIERAPHWLAYPITAVFLIGVTNAINLIDGLDGLAGGCMLLTLSAFAVLAYGTNCPNPVLIALASMGALFGFLRYNTYPASVFMGDGGSQFLGFTAGVLSVLMVGECQATPNLGVVLLALGLPVLDTALVIFERIAAGRSPFSPDKNHMHHKLMAMGLRHHEVVALAYLTQGCMIGAAFLLRDAAEWMLLVGLFAVVVGVLVGLRVAVASGWKMREEIGAGEFVERRNLWLRQRSWLPNCSNAGVRFAVAGFLVLGALTPGTVPVDVSVLAIAMAVFAAAAMIFFSARSALIVKISVYVAIAAVADIVASWKEANEVLAWVVDLYLFALAAVLIVAVRVTRRELFQLTPQDVLIILLTLFVPTVFAATLSHYHIGKLLVMLVALFYASEFVLAKDGPNFTVLKLCLIASLCILGVRGFLGQLG
jgi:UDP-GlcNAc:undecaprenyl-phosphate GlcNAc-1-phosphate transferase